jgi:hypothetical protein
VAVGGFRPPPSPRAPPRRGKGAAFALGAAVSPSPRAANTNSEIPQEVVDAALRHQNDSTLRPYIKFLRGANAADAFELFAPPLPLFAHPPRRMAELLLEEELARVAGEVNDTSPTPPYPLTLQLRRIC